MLLRLGGVGWTVVCIATKAANEITPAALLGATNPLASAPGTIRGDFAIVSIPTLIEQTRN